MNWLDRLKVSFYSMNVAIIVVFSIATSRAYYWGYGEANWGLAVILLAIFNLGAFSLYNFLLKTEVKK